MYHRKCREKILQTLGNLRKLRLIDVKAELELISGFGVVDGSSLNVNMALPVTRER
jgi:hypothetical protein